MSVRTNNVIGMLNKIDHALEVADKKQSFEEGLNIAKQVIGLLGIEDVPEVLKSFPRLKANPSWTKNAPDYQDRKASFALAENNDRNMDFKLYWVTKPAKRIISNLVALTPNFEDEAFYSNKSVGIDFILPDKADRLVVVLSSNYKIRTLEIHHHLSNTQKKIFEKWAQEFDFSNKAQVHKVLWDSFDIQPLNKEFYLGISELFTDLVQHLEKKNILDKKHRSQFVNRLIGRIIFCWFLRKKEIISEEAGYFETEGKPAAEYYAKKLEVLFFKVLNTSLDERGFGIDDKTPFLNGGLFEEKESDLAGLGELSFPSDYFDRFYSFLDRYNFTTDESTSDFQQVAIDPEMLGRIFENLLAEEIEETGEQARKAKGAFYTPREIVDYMCRESLRAYVSEKLGEDPRKGEVLQLLFDKREHELDPKSVLGKLGSYKNRIIDALDEIKIIDPACGSGAFPIGMLQIMLTIYERLDARLDHYKTKLTIIKNNIFGVDIEPMAVEISRLRTWLSLVVDSVIKPSEKNKGIEELPNLDFKFICANSLVPLEQEEGLFDNKQMADQMQAIRERYFKTNSQRIKDKMKRDFEDLLKKNQSMFASAKQKQLLTYHPFDSDNVCGFLDSEFVFGVRRFNLVIGNPPYGFHKIHSSSLKTIYKKYFTVIKGSFEHYFLFYEKAMELLLDKGVLAFIVPVTWLTIPSAKALRKLILENYWLTEICWFEEKIFLSANVNNLVSIMQKASPNKVNVKIYNSLKNFPQEPYDSRQYPQEKFIKQDYFIGIFEKQGDEELLQKLVNGTRPLKELAMPCSGYNPYEVGKGEKPGGGAQTKETVETKPYHSDKQHNKEWKTEIVGKDLDKYFLKITGQRWVKYGPWLAAARDPNNFVGKRILVREITGGEKVGIIATYYDGELYHSRDIIPIKIVDAVVHPNYLLAIINSSLVTWYHFKRNPKAQKKLFPKVLVSDLEKLPIKVISETEQRPLIKIVDNIFEITKKEGFDPKMQASSNKKVEELKAKVDEMVMELYELTKEEQEIVNKS